MFDLLIRNGTICDGTGAPAFRGDVGVRGDVIADIGDLAGAEARKTVDASGQIVAPGFIDAHTHSDAFILVEPFSPSKLTQGVTTEVCGMCGGSAAPKLDGALMPSDWEAQTYARSWTTVADYREVFEAAHPAVNVLMYAGHNTLRKGVTGNAPRAATSDETAEMCRRLEQALDEGAWGLSTGLIYHPGVHSRPEEVLALARTAAAKGGYYATHMRSEGDRLLEAVDEVLALGRATGIPLQLSHLKTSGKANWCKIDALVEKIESARAEGLAVHADRYPYLAAGTDLDIVLPDWAQAGGRDAILKNLADPALRGRIESELNASGRDWNEVMIGGTWSSVSRPFQGRRIGEVTDNPGALVAAVIEADGTRTGAFFFGMCEENLRRILDCPWVMPGSDASLRSPEGPLAADYPHPRAYGTMPRFYRMLREKHSAETAIARMTGLPAKSLGIPRRGFLQKGLFADIIILSPDRFRDVADYADPRRFSEGVELVCVNGGIVYESGAFVGSGKGRFLTREK